MEHAFVTKTRLTIERKALHWIAARIEKLNWERHLLEAAVADSPLAEPDQFDHYYADDSHANEMFRELRELYFQRALKEDLIQRLEALVEASPQRSRKRARETHS